MRSTCIIFFLCAFSLTAQSQNQWKGKFEQLGETLPTPNNYRTGSGAPGSNYWQQRADYVINVEVNDANQLLTGSETITYYNNAPEALNYLWLQLDQNIFADQSIMNQAHTGVVKDSIPAAFFGTASGVTQNIIAKYLMVAVDMNSFRRMETMFILLLNGLPECVFTMIMKAGRIN